MIVHSEYNWKSHDGLEIFARSWQPSEGTPKAIINLVHGLGEHGGRYEEWAGFFVDEGYALLALDFRGHGKSGGKRGHTDEYMSYMRDIGLLLSKSEELFPGIPVVLYGHSLGGNLVINYAIRFNPSIQALIATSPWLRLSLEPSRIKLLFASIVRNILPALQNSTGLSASQLSHDPEVAKKYSGDPLVHGKISVNAFFAIMHAGIEAIRNAGRINVPFLLVHGSEDMLTSCKASQELAQKGNDKLTFRLWNGGYHELHNEAFKKELFRFIMEWLSEQSGESTSKERTHGYF
jgi:alpha-beta hydrolase superfamily lysophospholipase